ncbi:MAG: response regulator [Deltaproteobacteria bacterium]|nr:response regulator [Deltaproteobacteria bacterium]
MKIRVLVVDDTRTVRFQERKLLNELGYEAEEATDGIEALEKIKEYKPHLILMDIMMPNMGGIECCQLIKSDNELKEIKVIMVSTKREFKKIDEAFKAGCDDYVIKPFSKEELSKKITELSEFVRCRENLRS